MTVSQVKNALTNIISELSETPWLFLRNPGKDFTRKRKLSFRIVRFKISDDSYETVITNLDFPPDDLKLLYAMRWGIETSFRDLKYTIGLSAFHSKKVEHILQEIFARFYQLPL